MSFSAPFRATIAVYGDDALAQSLDFPIARSVDDRYDFLLIATGERLELRDQRNAKLKPLSIDFTTLNAAGLSRRQPLARAIGKAESIVDATAGLAQDTLRLALMGYRVTAIERHAAVAALVQDGLRRFLSDHDLADRVRLLRGDARLLLPTLPPPEVVYLDPMFPPKRRASAAVRKELQWLRDLVGEDHDADALLDAALSVATYRVVVKRPDHAPPLRSNPAVSIAGKLVRYDVYSTRLKK